MTHTASQARREAFDRIRENIRVSGQHVYVVQQHVLPRFLYTIGLSAELGLELLMPGASHFMAEEAVAIANAVSAELKKHPETRALEFGEMGAFALGEVDESWSRALMLGAFDYLQTDQIRTLQVIPRGAFATLDTPDCSLPWDPDAQPVWRWLHQPWSYRVPDSSTAVTDLGTLQGRVSIEAARWEEDQWEVFSERGDQIPKERVRVVPIGTLLGIDPTLEPMLALAIGDGMLRDTVHVNWRPW